MHEFFLDATGKLTARITERVSASESAKTSSTVAGSVSRAGNSSYFTALMKFRGNDIDGSSSDILELEYNDVDEGTQLSAQDLDINGGDGGVWFFGCKPNNPVWDHDSAMHVIPESHSSPWTKTGAGSSSVTGGILTITTSASRVAYNRSSLVDLSQMTVEFKMRVTLFEVANATQAIQVAIRDDSMNRSLIVAFEPNGVTFGSGETTNYSTVDPHVFVPVNTKEWHQYRITTSGGTNPVVNLYIDGVLANTVTISTADATAADVISFGTNLSVASTTTSSEWEYFRVFDAGATAPVIINASTDGQLDDIAIANGIIPSGNATKLLTLEADVAYTQKFTGEFYAPNNQYSPTAAGSFTDDNTPSIAYIVGDGKTSVTVIANMKFLASLAGDLTFFLQFDSVDAGTIQSPYDKITVVANNDFSQSILFHKFVPASGITAVRHFIGSAAGGNIDVSDLGPMAFGMTVFIG
jgi:hypothetical protein